MTRVMLLLPLLLLLAPPALPPGDYALEVEIVTTTELPLVGEQRSVTRTLSHVVVDESSTAIAAPCAMTTRGPAFKSEVPAESLQAMPKARFVFSVENGRLKGDMGLGRVGFHGGGSIPTTPDDPRVVDVDGDGIPGMRVEVQLALGKVDVQMVAQARTVLDGVLDEGGARGRVHAQTQERILSGIPLGNAVQSSRVDPAASRFSLTRVDASSCHELRQQTAQR